MKKRLFDLDKISLCAMIITIIGISIFGFFIISDEFPADNQIMQSAYNFNF